MNKFFVSVTNIIKGGARSFAHFPASMISALVIAVTASVLIQLERNYNEKLFTSLQMAFFFGAIFSMTIAAAAIRRKGFSVSFWLGNFIALLLATAVFLTIYLPEGSITEITGARIVAGTAISFFLYLLVISRDEKTGDFNQAAFMTLKSFVIALIYGLVILLGLYFVAFAVESLLYEQMSSRVYQHIAVWSAFTGFAFFLGYFPSLGPDRQTKEFASAQRQPRFMEILFAYVVIPLMTALSAVLLIWTIQILIVGEWPSFTQLSTIFSSYALFGIWLYIMVSHYKQEIAVWYRRIFPFAALVFLAFEAYALIDRILTDGLKTGEYFVGIIWLFAVISAIMLVFLPVVRNRYVGWLAITLIAIIVMPFAGYQDLPARAQANRLKNVLAHNDMLVGDRIERAPADISQEHRRVITDATNFLLRHEEARQPEWFTGSIRSSMDFDSTYGFAPVYDGGGPIDIPKFDYIYLALPRGTIRLEDYNYAVHMREWGYNPEQPLLIETDRGEYNIELTDNISGSDPGLNVYLEGNNIAQHDLQPFLHNLALKYEDINSRAEEEIEFTDMLYEVTTDEFKLLLVFNSLEIRTSDTEAWQYTYNISSIYLAD